VFEHKGLKFGVVICSDGGYIEPTRLLALQGARVVFAPHFNYINAPGLIRHFMHVRADHTARAVENSAVYFVRGNNVSLGGKEESVSRYEGVGYGDSYIIDPAGEIVVRSRRHEEDFILSDIDVTVTDKAWGVGKSLWSARVRRPTTTTSRERIPRRKTTQNKKMNGTRRSEGFDLRKWNVGRHCRRPNPRRSYRSQQDRLP
jgi:hypothetical protein